MATVLDVDGKPLPSAVISARRAPDPWITAGMLPQFGQASAQNERDLGPLQPGTWQFAVTDLQHGTTFSVQRDIPRAGKTHLVLAP